MSTLQKVKLFTSIYKFYLRMSVKVAVRVRPFNSRERSLNCVCCVDMADPSTMLKGGEKADGEQKKFTFDFSFWSFDGFKEDAEGYLQSTGNKYADQQQVYKKIGTQILDNAWQGYHCCLFAYGQTGSGKSYSMIGYGKNKGIVPITCNQIFERAKVKKEGLEYVVHASMLQIYNQEIQDLTIPPAERVAGGLKIRENKLLGVYVDGVKKHLVTSFEQIEAVMDMGTKNRTVAATQMNATSSRAHTIITVEFIQKQKVGEATSEKISMINLVDLAGSQRQEKTGATGQRLKEAVGINQSLTSLGQVIAVLAKNSDGGKQDFVPYRNSALTRILQSALGGNSQTIMICAISPASDNYEESLSTLRYADSAKKIKNKPVVNENQTDKLIRQLKEENDRLKKALEGKGGAQLINNPDQGGDNQQQQQQISAEDAEKIKKKQEEFKKREEELKQKEAQQNAKLKEMEEMLAKKEAEQQEMLKKKAEQMKAFEQKIRAEEDAEKAEELKKLMEQQAKEDEENNRKILEQQKTLLAQQKAQQKMLADQKLLLEKSQQEHKKFKEQTANQKAAQNEANKKLEEQKNKKKAEDLKKRGEEEKQMDQNDEEIKANIDSLNKMLKGIENPKTEEERKKKAEKNQEQMKKANKTEGIIDKKELKELQKKGKLPPYFQNISRDVMINRKLKIMLQKNLITVGKANCTPPNDLVFGGRDINQKHATIHIVEGKVFLKPLSAKAHLYVNGKQVTDTVELINLDRVVFGWNSVYLFKNKHDDRSNEKIKAKDITWDFVREELAELVDIDQSDSEEGGGCCRMF